ncbi:uncharacterized protein LOC131245490 isoform X1 [Magnolia sinica]|uniref:uncharacterized protein LOC131245490 isoform X1 n=1 Tax=Magnolia sinica TaxID=86752 RepID=UPI00265A62B8|nr:uncharacterized protein LOC131245490 isoform X1 [Magnolia sinica]
MLFVRTVGGKLSGWTRNDTTPVLRSALNTIALRLSPCWISGVSRPLACSFSLNFCSAAQYPFLGSSTNLHLQKLVAGNSSYVDVEFIDPVIMAVSRGKLPLPMTHQISPDYNFNMLANFS